MFLNPLHVILSSKSELAGSNRIYRSIAKCFCNLSYGAVTTKITRVAIQTKQSGSPYFVKIAQSRGK